MENEQKMGADLMKTLIECIEKVAIDGYTENFTIKNHRLYSALKDKYFEANDTHIVNYYRFEGASNPEDMDILYVIETTDGMKGILTDAYGPYANAGINEFILKVQDIHKIGLEGKP